MKKALSLILAGLLLLLSLTGCSQKTKLDPDDPVTLTMWHVYGEQADSPMNRLIQEFNETVGLEKGIIIDVTMMSNAAQIGKKLLDAQKTFRVFRLCPICSSAIATMQKNWVRITW